MERGELVPDETTIGMFMEELAKPAAAAAPSSTASRARWPGKALDESLAAQGESVDRRLLHRRPDRGARAARRRPLGLPDLRHAVPRGHRAAARPGVCDKDGSPLVQRDDDRPEVVRARLEQQVPPMLAVIDHYERQGVVDRIDGRADRRA